MPLQSGAPIVSLAASLASPPFAQTVIPPPAPLAALAAPPTEADVSVLLADWTGPYGGQLPFSKVKVAAFEPALTAAMAQNLAEINAIAGNSDPPTFDNSIAAQERSGKQLSRVVTLYNVWKTSLNTSDEMKDVQTKMEPKLAEFADRITQNTSLFTRIDAVYQAREHSGLTPEQERLSWVYWNNFVKEGAKLSPDAKARVTAINQQLADLYTQFSQNLLADEGGYILYLKEADLSGLPQSVKAAAAAAAADKGHAGEFAILNTRSSMEPFLTYSARRDLREKVWRVYYSRCDNRDAHDNTITIIPQILRLRAEKAKLMGYLTYAHWKLQDQMAKTPDAAMELMMKVWPAAIQRVRQEVADMQALADQEHAGITIAPWDYRYYAEKVRKSKFDLDMDQVKPYLQLDKLREGMFWAAGQLYGLTFTRVDGVPVFDPHMVVYEVKDASGRHVALWYFDPYTRAGKDSGAWMNEYRPQQTLDAPVSTIVSNNANFLPPAPGQPVLVSWDDAVTLFHEFGHALHAINSNVTYPILAGTNVARDFVEFPSQLNENWLARGGILERFAVNAEGQPVPPELVAKILKAQTFNKGFDVTEYLAAAIIDMKLHLAGDTVDPDAFEKAELSKLGMPSELVMRHRTAQFRHIFSSDDYAAGYYGYLWAEVLDHDAFEAFLEAGGPYDPAVARRLHDDITSVGNTMDPAQAYRNFRGRDPEVGAYLRAKGFPIEAAST